MLLRGLDQDGHLVRVGTAAGARVGDELADEPQAEQLHADDDGERAEQQQRALPDGVAEHELVDGEVQLDEHADEDEQRAHPAEEVLWAVLVAAEEHAP